MESQFILSTFSGIGMLDEAFREQGHCVVSAGDLLWGSFYDIRRFHPPAGKFDGVIGGPPCQAFSSLAHLVRANGHEPRFGNLIPDFSRCVVESQCDWFVMENVPQAPEPSVPGYGVKSFLLDNSALPGEDGAVFGQEQRRVRRFTFGLRGRQATSLLKWIDLAVFLLPDVTGTLTQWTPDNSVEAKTRKQAVLGGSRAVPVAIGGSGKVKRTRQPCVTSTDGGERPSEKLRRGPVTASHDSLENTTAWSKRRRQKSVTGSGGGLSVQGLPEPEYNRRKAAGEPVRQRVKAVSGSNGGCGDGDGGRRTHGAGNNGKGRYRLADACRLQGLPEDFLSDSPFTAEGKLKAVANGVPLPMGRAIAKAVREALQETPK